MTTPLHAASIWLEGNEIVLRFEDSHEVRLPHKKINANGVDIGYTVLMDILQERAAAPASQKKIGYAASPVQYDIEGIIRAFSGTVKKAVPEPEFAIDLNELGIEI